MINQTNIFLIGPMGAGKTSVGKVLADELSMEYYDTDQIIKERAGANIQWIFDVEGERGYREREAKIIDELTKKQGILLATGGGAILYESNRQALAKHGTVIYLYVSVDQQVERTKRTDHRPLLKDQQNPRGILEELRKVRGPLYEGIADYTYDTDDKTVKEVVTAILNDIR